MKKSCLILSYLFCSFFSFLFAESSAYSLSAPSVLLTNYYSNGKIEKEIIKRETENCRENFLINKDKNDFLLLVEYLNVYAVYSLMEADLRENLKEYDNLVEKNISDFLDDGKILNVYLDFKWNEISLGNNFTIINHFPFYCRLLSKHDDYKTCAMLKLALWYIYATDSKMAGWNTFIKNQEIFIYDMTDVEKYNVFLHYAIFYMKLGCHSRALDLLKKAEEVFPENLMHFILTENLKKGVYGW